jgi:ABC-type metal ion transport system substrate-binding protein
MTSAPIPFSHVDQSWVQAVEAAFVARALASLDKARVSGEYVDVATTLSKLDAMLLASRQAKQQRLGG